MTYYGAKELAAAFRTVRDNTIKIAEEVGEEHYGFRATPETRSIAETLVHIANMPKMPYEIHAVKKVDTLVGFDFLTVFAPILAAEKQQHSKADILKMLVDGRDQFANWLETVPDDFLAQRVSMPAGPNNTASKSRFEMLLGPKEHEMHHRGQLMLMERMIGVVPHLTRQMQARFAEMQAAMQAQTQAHTQQAGKQ